MGTNLMQGVKNIMFDLGGVIIDLNRQHVIDAFKAIGCEQIGLSLDNSHQQGLFLDLDEGRISPAQFHDKIREITGLNITDEAIDHAYNQFLVGIPLYKLQMLRHLREHYKIIMLSNTNAIMFESEIPKLFTAEGLTMNDYFDRIFTSYELGISKPDPRCFQAVIDQSGIIPSETLFLDDSQANLDVAAQMGFKTYLALPYQDYSSIFNLL